MASSWWRPIRGTTSFPTTTDVMKSLVSSTAVALQVWRYRILIHFYLNIPLARVKLVTMMMMTTTTTTTTTTMMMMMIVGVFDHSAILIGDISHLYKIDIRVFKTNSPSSIMIS